jgi:hypothetical protein
VKPAETAAVRKRLCKRKPFISQWLSSRNIIPGKESINNIIQYNGSCDFCAVRAEICNEGQIAITAQPCEDCQKAKCCEL